MYKLTWSQLSELHELCDLSSMSSMLHNTHTLRLHAMFLPILPSCVCMHIVQSSFRMLYVPEGIYRMINEATTYCMHLVPCAIQYTFQLHSVSLASRRPR